MHQEDVLMTIYHLLLYLQSPSKYKNLKPENKCIQENHFPMHTDKQQKF